MSFTAQPQWRPLARKLGVPSVPHESEPRLRSRADLYVAINEDLRAHGVDRYRWYYRFTHRVLYFHVLLRRAEYWDGCGRMCAVFVAPLVRLRSVRLGELLGFTVPMHVVAPGFSIAHPGTVVISHLASVGRDCRVHTDVCIGEVGQRAPVIGDHVWIGPGAKIFGPITVGDRAVIGANAVVLEDVPADVTVAGVPARVVSQRDSSRLLPVVTSLTTDHRKVAG